MRQRSLRVAAGFKFGQRFVAFLTGALPRDYLAQLVLHLLVNLSVAADSSSHTTTHRAELGPEPEFCFLSLKVANMTRGKYMTLSPEMRWLGPYSRSGTSAAAKTSGLGYCDLRPASGSGGKRGKLK